MITNNNSGATQRKEDYVQACIEDAKRLAAAKAWLKEHASVK